RGIVLTPDNTLYVADFSAPDDVGPGRVAKFHYDPAGPATSLGDLDASNLASVYGGEYHPKGIVFRPDGLLYVAGRNIGPRGGAILRFEGTSGTLLDVFAQNDGSNDLNRPEGLVFGPDRNLYITSFRANAFDTDKVIEFAGPGQPTPGAYIGKIDLAQPEA